MKTGFLLLICLLAYFAPVSAVGSEISKRVSSQITERNMRFNHLDTVSGLSQDSVQAIAQDHNGFIWIATQEGLNRYDGQNIVVFEREPDALSSLSHNFVYDLFVARNGELWAATDGGGVSIYDPETESFRNLSHNPNDPATLSSDRVRSVYQDSIGNVWIGTVDAGLNRIDGSTGIIQRYRHDPEQPDSLPHDSILVINEDRRGRLWIGTDGGGLARYEPTADRFLRYQPDADGGEGEMRGREVTAVVEDRDGALWIGTRDAGLQRLDTETGKWVMFQREAGNPNSLSNNYVRDILEDKDGTLWIATDFGLNEWRPNEGGFAQYFAVDTDSASLSTSRLSELFQSSSGVLWVGSYRGVSTWNYMSDAFTHYHKSNGMLPADLATDIGETSDSVLWIGTYGGGLTSIDRRNGAVMELRHDENDPTSLSSDVIMVVFTDADDKVWAGTRRNGLNRYDPETGEITHLRKPELTSNAISALWGDPDGTLWIGTFGGGLNRLLPDGTLTWFQHDPEDATSIGSDRVLSVTRDKRGTLWIGTEEGGLNRFDAATGTFERILHDPDDPLSLSADTAWEIAETTDGSLWIATLNGGLNQWQAADRAADRKKFRRWTKASGLVSNTIYGLLEDDQGRLWLSSNRGISRFNLKTYDIRHYDRRNGLSGDEFNLGARYRSRMGQLLFGGSGGVVSFVPGQIQDDESVPPTVVRAYSPFKRLAVSYTGNPAEMPAEIEYEDNFIAFEFAALNYASPNRHKFRYMLQGFDKEWQDPGTVRRITYANLSPGSYLFRVKTANSDGIWNEQGTELAVQVLPAPWQTVYAYSFYGVLAVVFMVYAVRWYLARRKRESKRRELLEAQVRQRTAEIGERNRQLESLNQRLLEASFKDSLTDLYNRRYLNEFIEQQVHIIDRDSHDKRHRDDVDYSRYQQTVLSFMMIDLDGFKAINDTYGHAAGDKALLQVRDVLLDCVRESDIIIRWGGDEFLIVGQTLGIAGIANFAERVRFAVTEQIYRVGNGRSAQLSCSIGAVPYPFVPLRPDLMTWEQALNLADTCAYVVKGNGRNGWAVMHGTPSFTSADNDHISSHLESLLDAGKAQMTTSIREPLKLPFVEGSEAS